MTRKIQSISVIGLQEWLGYCVGNYYDKMKVGSIEDATRGNISKYVIKRVNGEVMGEIVNCPVVVAYHKTEMDNSDEQL